MAQHKFIFVTLLISGLISFSNGFGQTWDFVKEKDGVRIYTRKEANTSLKSFRGETVIHAPVEKFYPILGDSLSFDWWAKDIHDIKVLFFESGKEIRYYLVYDVPWPLADRDLCVRSKVTTNPATGERTLYATPLLNVVPEKPENVRIKNYWQKWYIKPLEKGNVQIILEGSVDPGGIVPNWLLNMVITETPLKVIRNLRERVLHGKVTRIE